MAKSTLNKGTVVPPAVRGLVLPAVRSPDASAVFLVVVTEFCVLFPDRLHHVSEMAKLKSAAVGRETKIYKCKNLLVPGPYLGCSVLTGEDPRPISAHCLTV